MVALILSGNPAQSNGRVNGTAKAKAGSVACRDVGTLKQVGLSEPHVFSMRFRARDGRTPLNRYDFPADWDFGRGADGL